VRDLSKKYGGKGGAHVAKPLTEFQRKQQETNDVRAQLKNFAIQILV
jgi:hypothetical protein